MAQSPAVFTTQLDLSLKDKLYSDLENQGFSFSQPPYSLFSAKKKGISCTLYASGKLVVQGKESAPFIEFYLEPELLKELTFTHKAANIDKTGRIGVDESGKGDFFGPLCVAAVYAEGDGIEKLITMGAVDSKKLTDLRALQLAKEIKAEFPHHIVRINPFKYNELYEKFGNLNRLLAWGHATTIEQMVIKTKCSNVLVDKFAHETLVEKALKQKSLLVKLTQRHRAEADPVVAAASIVARAAFLEGLNDLSQEFQMQLLKGASSQVIAMGRRFASTHGAASLPKVCKMHFKTLDSITS